MQLTNDLLQTLPIEEIATIINTQLETYNSLTDLCSDIGVTYSKVTALFNKHDYAYVGRYKKYLKVNLQDNTLDSPLTLASTCTTSSTLSPDEQALMDYLINNKDKLVALLTNNRDSTHLIIDKRILSSTESSSKKLTLHDATYEQFITLCTNQYPQYQAKHLLAQAMIEFIDKYGDTTL